MRVAQQAQTDASYAQDDSADVSAVRPPTSNLVETPVSVSKGRAGVGMSTPAQPSQAPPPLQPIDTTEKQCSAGVAAAVLAMDQNRRGRGDKEAGGRRGGGGG